MSDEIPYVEPVQTQEAEAWLKKEARQLLQHRAFDEAIAASERRIFKEWGAATNPLDRERLHAKLGALRILVTELRVYSQRP